MNDFREMVRADLAARLKATVKRRRPKPKGTLPRAAIAAEVLPMFQEEARKRQLAGLKRGTEAPVPVKRSERGFVGEARDEAAAMMNVSPASVGRDRLNRQTHGTFEDYCKERWGMTDRRARQLMDASEVVEEIGTIVPVSPATESQARPLTKLEPEAQRQAWARAVVEVASTTVDIRAHVVENVSAVADIPAPQSERQARLPVHRSIHYGGANRTHGSHSHIRASGAHVIENVSTIVDKAPATESQTHGTFEDYCKERWGMHRSRAYRLIEAAETVEALSPMGDTVPNNERQARPLTKLEPEQQRQACNQLNRSN